LPFFLRSLSPSLSGDRRRCAAAARFFFMGIRRPSTRRRPRPFAAAVKSRVGAPRHWAARRLDAPPRKEGAGAGRWRHRDRDGRKNHSR
ncbi:hypothetical protein BRADI_4g21195v3, partial [Brachypodium distachyon]